MFEVSWLHIDTPCPFYRDPADQDVIVYDGTSGLAADMIVRLFFNRDGSNGSNWDRTPSSRCKFDMAGILYMYKSLLLYCWYSLTVHRRLTDILPFWTWTFKIYRRSLADMAGIRCLHSCWSSNRLGWSRWCANWRQRYQLLLVVSFIWGVRPLPCFCSSLIFLDGHKLQIIQSVVWHVSVFMVHLETVWYSVYETIVTATCTRMSRLLARSFVVKWPLRTSFCLQGFLNSSPAPSFCFIPLIELTRAIC